MALIEVEGSDWRCEKGCGGGGGRLCVCMWTGLKREGTAGARGRMGRVAVAVSGGGGGAGGGGEGLVGRWMVGGCGRGSDDELCWRRGKVGGVVLER